MAQIGSIVTNRVSKGGKNEAKRFHNVGDKSFPLIARENLKELVKFAYANGVAAMEWKEAGIFLVAETDEDGNLVVKKSK